MCRPTVHQTSRDCNGWMKPGRSQHCSLSGFSIRPPSNGYSACDCQAKCVRLMRKVHAASASENRSVISNRAPQTSARFLLLHGVFTGDLQALQAWRGLESHHVTQRGRGDFT